MHVTNREAERWNRVQRGAILRKLEQARMDVVRSILQGQDVHAPTFKPAKDERRAVAVKQGRLF